MVNKIRLIGVATLLLVGCSSSTDSNVDRSAAADSPSELENVTFYVAAMNQQLQIL